MATHRPLPPSRPRASTASLRSNAGRKGKAVKQMVEDFLAEVGGMGERCPTDDELQRARRNLEKLEELTRVDHIRSVDEVVAQIPVEFNASCRALEAAERFILTAAGGEVADVTSALTSNWELLTAVDRDGHTALHAACACDCVEVVRYLLAMGAKPNTQDFQGFTPLHWAIENGALACVGLLLSAGGDASIRTNTRKLPTDLMGHLKPKLQTHIGKVLACDRDEVEALSAALARGDLIQAGTDVASARGGKGPGMFGPMDSAPAAPPRPHFTVRPAKALQAPREYEEDIDGLSEEGGGEEGEEDSQAGPPPLAKVTEATEDGVTSRLFSPKKRREKS